MCACWPMTCISPRCTPVGALALIDLKEANRRVWELVAAYKERTQRANAGVDAAELKLQNLQYEKNHFLRELIHLRDFHPDTGPKIEMLDEVRSLATRPHPRASHTPSATTANPHAHTPPFAINVTTPLHTSRHTSCHTSRHTSRHTSIRTSLPTSLHTSRHTSFYTSLQAAFAAAAPAELRRVSKVRECSPIGVVYIILYNTLTLESLI